MSLRFSCTACGRCCHGLRIPLSIAEAFEWTSCGGLVQIFCHAAPPLHVSDEPTAYKRDCRFDAKSGSLALQVQVIIAARFEGACPNFGPDLLCTIYDQRPAVCRVYPAVIQPGMTVKPSDRLCPPEAWSDEQPIFLNNAGEALDTVTRDAIMKARKDALLEVYARQRLVTSLGVDVAGLENEGFAVWTIGQELLNQALGNAAATIADASEQMPEREWRFMTMRAETAALITDAGGLLFEETRAGVEYLPLY